jgi:hypothetical protein
LIVVEAVAMATYFIINNKTHPRKRTSWIKVMYEASLWVMALAGAWLVFLLFPLLIHHPWLALGVLVSLLLVGAIGFTFWLQRQRKRTSV